MSMDVGTYNVFNQLRRGACETDWSVVCSFTLGSALEDGVHPLLLPLSRDFTSLQGLVDEISQEGAYSLPSSSSGLPATSLGPDDLEGLICCSSLRMPSLRTSSGGVLWYLWPAVFRSWLGSVLSVVNTEVNWSWRIEALVFESEYSWLFFFKGDTPTVSCRWDLM